ncbi:MAG: inorganic diphosphatase [Caldilineales bacterium]|nr:inorganic diphosphatase [Caldilineales bacterium]MDW8319285.1 inorganic diphosphatase [Anaerolineae bacterium]
MQNLWRELRTGPQVPEVIYAIVEIPKGSRNKYEYQKVNGVIFLDRVLYSSMVYPGDYGLIPQTFYPDGDPLDILVMVSEPTFPGCIIQARPIGLFRMMDRDVEDAKVLAVPATDPLFHDYHDLDDVPKGYLNEVAHFFEVYKDLEGQRTRPIGWEDAAAAKQEILKSVALYKERFGLKEL